MAEKAFITYLVSYALEGPLRYALDGVHADGLILLRDVLLDGSLVLVVADQIARGDLPLPAAMLTPILALGVFVAWGSGVAIVSWALGLKTFLNLLFGVTVPAAIIGLGERHRGLVCGLLLVSVCALFVEKFVVDFPWVGLHASIGGVQVELSRDWQISDTFNKRVGGLTKLSISAANVVSILTILVMTRSRSRLVAAAICVPGLAGVFLTTQKGALLGLSLTCLLLMLRRRARVPALAVASVLALAVDVGLPFLTQGLDLPQGNNGPFSASSIGDRIMTTWPATRDWIEQHGSFPFGLGVGGVGQAESYGTAIAPHYPDNLFLFLFATFGIFAWFFPAVVITAVIRSFQTEAERAATSLAILVFLLADGTFITILEDPLGAMFLGAAVTTLVRAEGGAWSRALKPATMRAVGR